MAIIYYPNRIYKGKVPAIDRVMAIRKPASLIGSANVSATALDVVLGNDSNWQVNSIEWSFSNANSRTFDAYIMGGRRVVEDLNDYLWFQMVGTHPQRITLTPGFYTGTELATELETRLEANAAFTALGVTFTVTYNAITGIFTITPSSGTIRYWNYNSKQYFMWADSIAGHLFGLTADTAFASNVASDTTVFGLNNEVPVVALSNNTSLTYLHNDIHTMTVDQAIHLTSNSGSDVTVDYVVNYETIV